MYHAPSTPRRSNCVFWAFRQRITHPGTRIQFRRSFYNPLKFHCIWIDASGRAWGYSPAQPRKGYAALLHGMWFRGYVVREEN